MSLFYFAAKTFLFLFILNPRASAEPAELQFTAESGRQLAIRMRSERVFKFTYLGSGADRIDLIEPQVMSDVSVKKTETGFETSSISVVVSAKTLCMSITDKMQDGALVEICADGSGLTLAAPQMTHVYGLGEQFDDSKDLNWVGKIRAPGTSFGNRMVEYQKGFVGNAQFPVIYALGGGYRNFALVFDNVYAQTWDFTKQPWTVKSSGGSARGYFIAGQNLKALRQSFMTIAGRPLVPPLKAFGLWVSEYGFDSWRELEGKLRTLKERGFPIDGFVLDLQWFGGIKKASELSAMGGLQWNEKSFPNPAAKIADLKKQGIGIIAIEEPYVSAKVADRDSGRPVFEALKAKGCLARGAPQLEAPLVRLDPKAWWGSGGMLDFVNPRAADFWHDWKRQKLVEVGVMGHWTDLGEPEMFSPNSFYGADFRHAEIHNVYNRFWSESIYRGYERNKNAQRPWILSRSGAMGSQKYGVAMWSGDIGSNFESLASHVRVQNHMSLSGIDYFGSDIGGFHREALRGNLDELYTQWFANATLFDIPIRPHTENLCNCKETAPDRIGDRASNLENLKLRYSLRPYYYSLAHAAHDRGQAIVSPLAYEFQEDLTARSIADEKMIGPFILAAAVTAEGAKTKDVYLPQGGWRDLRSGASISSKGEWLRAVPLRATKTFQLPIYLREGAIVPMMNETGGLQIRLAPSARETDFDFFEDDGASIGYLNGERRLTVLSQRLEDKTFEFKALPAAGDFPGAVSERSITVRIATDLAFSLVNFNGEILPRVSADDANGGPGWWPVPHGIVVRTPRRSVREAISLEMSLR